jgi:hypothetical protein
MTLLKRVKMKPSIQTDLKCKRHGVFVSKQTKYIYTTLIYTPNTHINTGLLNKDDIKNV